ncbi:MAG: hypothetical protein M3N14_08495 [Bacteroidota bacterium]|nr:hypothetical protein [Bacteroidota bacterium]
MDTMEIDILDPKARKLLKNLADMNLISIRKSSNDKFLSLVHKIRAKAKNTQLSLDEITKEVEIVRSKRYAASEKKGNH